MGHNKEEGSQLLQIHYRSPSFHYNVSAAEVVRFSGFVLLSKHLTYLAPEKILKIYQEVQPEDNFSKQGPSGFSKNLPVMPQLEFPKFYDFKSSLSVH